MCLAKKHVDAVRDAVFKHKVYTESTADLRNHMSMVLFKFIQQISLLACGGLTLECTLESMLTIVAWCLGPSNVRIHGYYSTSVSKFKVIVAPISALKSPQYRLVKNILKQLDKVLDAAVSSLRDFSSNEDNSDSEDFSLGSHADTNPFLEPGTFEGLE